MKIPACVLRCVWMVRCGPSTHALVILCSLVLLLPQAAGAAGTVTNCTEACLRAMMAGGGTVTFACDGMITLANPLSVLSNTVLDAAGHTIAISGGGVTRCFQVDSNVVFILANLTITNGVSTNGGGIYNEGGIVSASNCTFSGNSARQARLLPVPSLGGAICSLSGELTLQSCGFTSNAAWGGVRSASYPIGCDGYGGAVYSAGNLRAGDCSFLGNAAGGGNVTSYDYAGGAAKGGAVYCSGSALLTRSLFATNTAVGGVGGQGAPGSYIPPYLPGNQGGAGGDAYGGALCCAGVVQIVNCTLAGNQTIGGGGGNGGDGPWGGNGGGGGDAAGAIWSEAASVTGLTNCTVALNTANPGAGGFPGTGVPGGTLGPAGLGIGGVGGANVRLINTLMATNSPGNGSSSLTDLGYNLSSDSSLVLPGTSSITNADPKLGPLADYGGPTLTIELLPESPAINAGDTASAPSCDQRGVARPVGPATDIGAFEFVPMSPRIVTPPASQSAPIGTDVEFMVEAAGSPRLAYQWFFNMTNSLGGRTNTVLRLTNVQPVHAGDYRVVVANQFGSITSPPAMLTVTAVPPFLTALPTNQSAAVASNASFYASAAGSLPLAYQWFFNATNALRWGTNASLTLTNVLLTDAGAYTIRVTNLFGAVTSAPATLTVFGIPPVIVTSPLNRAAVVGTPAEFSVSASGSPPVTYRWTFNGSNSISVTTNAMLRLETVSYAQAGLYAAVVGNAFGSATSAPALLTVTPPGTTAVANPNEGELRAAMAGGGRVVFACDGVVTLSSTIEVVASGQLDSAGRNVAIDGGGTVQCFQVESNVLFALANLTIANGLSASGGALFNAGGLVNASNCVFVGNRAAGPAGSDIGQNGSPASGGAVHNGGSFFAAHCAFLNNRAEGGRGADGNPIATLVPPLGGVGAPGNGGALCNLGAMRLESCLIASNSAAGGGGGVGSAGDYYIAPGMGYATSGGRGGAGAGGALFNAGTLTLVNCTVVGNQGRGGSGGTGGHMNGPYPPVLSGASGGSGGDGIGVICCTNGMLCLTNCTGAFNSGSGGNGGDGGSGGPANWPGRGGDGGGGVGGCALPNAQASLVNCLLSSNIGVGRSGGYGWLSGDKYNPVFAYSPAGYASGNLRGVVNDLGHNLSSDDSAAITNTTSFRNTDPKLGPLANNGGPTPTMCLLSGSPAIDAGDETLELTVDQRGFPRPIGRASDIGAFEYGSPAFMTLAQGAAGGFDMTVTGKRGQTYWLFASESLLVWSPIITNQFGSNGTAVHHLKEQGVGQFYRVLLP